jgi:alpha-tubulin suppressor-like RCC1 family protein
MEHIGEMGGVVRLVSLAMVLALAAACTKDVVGPPPITDLTGLWDWTARREFPADTTVCSDTGSFVFVRQGAGYLGIAQWVGHCSNGGAYSYAETDSLRSIVISGSTLTFAQSYGFDTCADTASTAPGAADELVGTATCIAARVTWRAVRATPLVSVGVSPATLLTVPGATPALTAVLRTASGSRAFGRTVSWSTDISGVVAVDSSGLVTPLAAGTAHVIASAEGHTGSAAVTVLPPTSFGWVGAGDARTCALGADGYAYCWGLTPALGRSTLPLPAPGTTRFTAITMGHRFACGLVAGGAAYCWGANESGQLGNGSQDDFIAPVAVAGGHVFASVSAGGHHACGLAAGGAAWCWGAGGNGQLGGGSTASSTVPVPVAGGRVFMALSAGAYHTCGIATDPGTLYCWGDNRAGQIGDSTTVTRTAPVPVWGGVARVSAGYWHTCAVASGGAAYCWGSGGAGQLGTGSIADQHSPAPVAGGHVFVAISAGLIHSCGVDAGGAAWCWGVNSWGQLGNASVYTPPAPSPAPVSGGLIFTSVSSGLYTYSDETINAGTAAHTCGVTTAGLAYCWGVNNIGQVGNEQTSFSAVVTPTKVSGQP